MKALLLACMDCFYRSAHELSDDWHDNEDTRTTMLKRLARTVCMNCGGQALRPMTNIAVLSDAPEIKIS